MEGIKKNMGLLLLLAAACWVGLFSEGAWAREDVPAMFVFGDSSADVGNNNYLPGDLGKANFPHNGIDYPHGEPTGRFSNGYNGVDFLAKKLGFKRSPPAYLSITSDAQIFKGVNFASGGSGILDSTGQNFSLPMNTQIKYFEGVVRLLKTGMSGAAADLFLSKSLFVFNTANNDLFVFYLATGLKNRTQADQFIDLLAYQLRTQLQTLYKLGARKFAVFAPSVLGCIPLLRRTSPSGDCVEAVNQFFQQFNQATKLLLYDLAANSDGMLYAFVDAYEVISTVMAKPSNYGFKEIRSACCGSGRFNAESGCTPNATYCANRRDHLFWDQSHATQATSRLVVEMGYRGGRRFTTPKNIEQLVKS